eukprot:TRINITY_DN14262_c0_g1_i1.p1 TRINITY_DN14262_c0_g1~~TRINITY_DN14262_c0_g1_i1.p1  ORF type:complete len:417 (+),score=65.20 TRINITY_DN14262_c0_g1_i1:61-1311(+)
MQMNPVHMNPYPIQIIFDPQYHDGHHAGIGVLAHAAMLKKSTGLGPDVDEAARALSEAEQNVVPSLLPTSRSDLYHEMGVVEMHGLPPARLTWRPREIKRLQNAVYHVHRGINPQPQQMLTAMSLEQPRKRLRDDDSGVLMEDDTPQLQAEFRQDLIDVKAETVDWEKVGNFFSNKSPLDCRTKWEELQQFPQNKGKWAKDEDERLRDGVKLCGESAWKAVSEFVKTRNSQQCLHRWLKSLKPNIKRTRWQAEEDEYLRKAVKEIGPNWSRVQTHVPGRTDVQCRERWMNVLNPVIARQTWTSEEDDLLIRSVQELGTGQWSVIAKERFMGQRTDYQIRKRMTKLKQMGKVSEDFGMPVMMTAQLHHQHAQQVLVHHAVHDSLPASSADDHLHDVMHHHHHHQLHALPMMHHHHHQ